MQRVGYFRAAHEIVGTLQIIESCLGPVLDLWNVVSFFVCPAIDRLIIQKAPLSANRPFSLLKDRCIEEGFWSQGRLKVNLASPVRHDRLLCRTADAGV